MSQIQGLNKKKTHYITVNVYKYTFVYKYHILKYKKKLQDILCQIFLVLLFSRILYELRHDKTSKMSVRPAKTQISLRCPHEESLCP